VDYIQEMLLRQKEMLSVLMLGGKNSGEDDAEILVEASEKRMDSGERTVKTAPGKVYQNPQHDSLKRAGETGQMKQVMSGYANRYLAAENEKQIQMAASVAANAAGRGWNAVLEAGEAQSQSANTKEMSRAIQRDARRYDGGFSIY